MKITRVIIVSVLFLVVAVGGSFAAARRVMVRGRGITLTAAEVAAMKKVSGQAGRQTSKNGLVDGALRVKLFAVEARREGLECPAAADKSGFEQDIALARCYQKARLATLTLRDEAVESYYRAHWQRFVDKEDGVLRDLDAELRKTIEDRILAVKKNNFGLQEYERLCEKYHIVFTGNGS